MNNSTLSELIKSGIKDDAKKLPVSAVPPQIILDIAEVRQYGIQKYPESGKTRWKEISPERWFDAYLRHTLAMWQNGLDAIDSESGIPHRKLAAANLAFICELMGGEK